MTKKTFSKRMKKIKEQVEEADEINKKKSKVFTQKREVYEIDSN